MAEFPALPIFTDAYLADTRHLTAAQHGAYLLLLMMAWRTPDCSLPDDDEKLARWSCMDKRTWKANKETILSFWTRNNSGHLIQKRLLDERKYVEQLRNKNVRAGKISALKRLNRGSTTVQPEPNKTSTPIPTPTPTPIPIENKDKKDVRPPRVKREDGQAVAAPDFFDEENFETIPAAALVKISPKSDLPMEWGEYAQKLGWQPDQIMAEWHKLVECFSNGSKAGARRSVKGWRKTWAGWIERASRSKL